jgi:PKD repeat protein
MKIIMKHILSIIVVLTSFFSFSQTAVISTPDALVCVGEAACFSTSTSIPGSSPLVNSIWSILPPSGPPIAGNSAPGQDFCIENPVPGIYRAGVINQYQDGSAVGADLQDVLTVVAGVSASIGATVNSCNVPFGVTYDGAGSTAGTTMSWVFESGNPATFSGPNPPMINYTTPNDYDVTLTVTDPVTGCTATATRTMNVSNYETAMDIPDEACVGQTVVFNDVSTVGVSAWTWSATPALGVTGTANFNSTSDSNPTVSFNAPGDYIINLASSNGSVPCNSTAIDTITIKPLPSTPSFSQGNQSAACAPAIVQFTNTTTQTGLTYSWNFGNGTAPFTGTNPAPQVYSGNGTFTPSVTVTNQDGCSAGFSGTPIVLSSPVANFKVDLKDGCQGQNIQFTDLSTVTPAINQWIWDFGDGSPLSNTQNPIHSYLCGIYDVTLIIVSGTCRDTVTLSEGAIPNGAGYETSSAGAPDLLLKYGTHTTPTFTLDHHNDCIKKEFEIVDMTQIACPHVPADIKRLWLFNGIVEAGDSIKKKQFTDTLQNIGPDGIPGIDVGLIMDFRGCKDTLDSLNQIYISSPISKFQAGISLFCDTTNMGIPNQTGAVVNLDDSQSIYGHGFTASTLVLDSIIPSQADDDVVVIYRWGDGTQDLVEDNDVFLDDNPTVGGDNGGGVDPANTTLGTQSAASPVSHTYLQYGTYEITQVIENRTTGCIDSTTATINVSWISTDYVFDEAPLNQVLFDDKDSVCIGSPFNMIPRFDSPDTEFTHASHGPVGHSFSSSNSAFSGSSGTGSMISAAGIVPITLTTTNAVGCSATAFGQMTSLALPIANFSLTDVSGCVGVPYPTQATNSSSHAPGGYTLGSNTTAWAANDGFNWTINGGTPLVTGNYNETAPASVIVNTTYTLVVKDLFGCTSVPFSATAIVNQPNAGLNIANQVCNSDIPNGLITFTGNGNINPTTGYTWIIDGTQLPASGLSSIPFPPTWEVMPPATSGQHSVGLIVEDMEGCKDTLQPAQSITIIAPQADFTFAATGTSTGIANEFNCPPVVVNFTDASLSTGAPVSNWLWEFNLIGDPSFGEFGDAFDFSYEQSPQGMQVLRPGVYDIRYTIAAGGCVDVLFIDSFLVIQGPSGDPNITLVPGPCGQTFDFELTNQDQVATWSWELGDGTTVTSAEEADNLFPHLYSGVQTYYPTITLVDDVGCAVPYHDTIVIAPNGVEALFTTNTDEINLGTNVIFDDASGSVGGNLIEWIWNFGDGRIDTVATGIDQSNQYFVGGDVTVLLKVTDDRQCSDEFIKSFYIDIKFDMPNVFTGLGSGGPNADLALFADVFKDFEVTIVNRWGNTVYQGSRDVSKPRYLWNGIDQASSKLCSEGTYYYILKGTLKNDVPIDIHGFVTLIGTLGK